MAALTLFFLVERDSSVQSPIADVLTCLLLAATLGLEALALSAILSRLSSYSFSPNRAAVLGANLVVSGHLATMAFRFLQVLRGREPRERLANQAARYLVVYPAWCAFVAFAFPVLFRFR